uniref:HMA domain-containing protein n=1 Tax=Leersia perrieri TaxID=77586 RepID=A0A0D9UZ34_9ORYZ
MSKKTVIRSDLIGKACKSEILATVATLQGIKSMDIDAEKCTLTVVGTVDPVRISPWRMTSPRRRRRRTPARRPKRNWRRLGRSASQTAAPVALALPPVRLALALSPIRLALALSRTPATSLPVAATATNMACGLRRHHLGTAVTKRDILGENASSSSQDLQGTLKTVIKSDLIGKACKSEIMATVATLQGIKSMDIDAEKCTLTVVGTVDPVRIVRKLKKKCFAACIVTVEDDKPKEEEKKDPCKEAKEKLEKAWKEVCEKCTPCPPCPTPCPLPCPPCPTPCPPPCPPPDSRCYFPPNGCHRRGMWPPPPPPGCYEERYPWGECVIQ